MSLHRVVSDTVIRDRPSHRRATQERGQMLKTLFVWPEAPNATRSLTGDSYEQVALVLQASRVRHIQQPDAVLRIRGAQYEPAREVREHIRLERAGARRGREHAHAVGWAIGRHRREQVGEWGAF